MLHTALTKMVYNYKLTTNKTETRSQKKIVSYTIPYVGGNMKRHLNTVSALAGVMALSIMTAGVIGGCSATEETTSEETSSEETTVETTTEETTTTSAQEVVVENMRPRTPSETNLHYIYSDLNDIEDEETRELAQSYADEGFVIYDQIGPERYGDNDLEFSTGFSAECITENGWTHIIIWKMSEEQYEYYILDRAVWWGPEEGDLEDDGTVITRSLYNPTSHFEAYFEYNRDTGFMTFCEVEPRSEYWPLFPEDIEDPELYARAIECIECGYVLAPGNNTENYESISGGTCGEQFQYYDGEMHVEYTVMGEDVFNAISSPDYCYSGGANEMSDDGNVVTRTYYDEYGNISWIYEYDRTTGICCAQMAIDLY